MGTRIAPAMRKQPSQARSRATVEAIIEAGAQVLARKGAGGFNTNEVAAVAGVSIGSLYQYFPDKAALVQAIVERHYADILAVLASADDAAALVDGLIAIHRVHPALHVVLLEEAAPQSREAREAFEAQYLGRYEAMIAARGPASRTAARVLAAALEGAVHEIAAGAVPEDGREELLALVERYLGVRR